jgi:hypothetical protein
MRSQPDECRWLGHGDSEFGDDILGVSELGCLVVTLNVEGFLRGAPLKGSPLEFLQNVLVLCCLQVHPWRLTVWFEKNPFRAL